METTIDKTIGAVVIGRNEGDRLIACIESLKSHLQYVVYVDSGSEDASLQEAEKRDVDCVSLDMSQPFTAARARNEGARYLLEKYSEIEFIQFVDGDCVIQPSWIETAHAFLVENPSYALTCGRRRERFPESTVYNQLCDIEWDTPIGDAKACGGDVLIRVSSFKQVDGYNGALIAGEEPEMCFRLRVKGWKVYRLDSEMTLHDAAMTHIGQWWNRAKRAGYAYAQGCYLHGKSREKYNVKPTRSIIVWAALLPMLIIVSSIYNPMFLALFICYPVQIVRLSIKNMSQDLSLKNSIYYAMSNVCGKFPQCVGALRFLKNQIQNRQSSLIEYK